MLQTSSLPDSSLGRRFFRLAGLNILANLTVPITGLVDTAMLGHLEDIRFLAGVALGALLFDYIYWSLGFLRMGTTGTTAQAVGAQDREQTYLILYRSLSLALMIGGALLLLQPLIREAGFRLLSGETGVEAAGRDYFSARIWGAPAVLANFALIGWFLGREESGRALLISGVGNVANVALNYLFIIRWEMAATGAGLATALAQYLMLAIGMVLFLSEGKPLAWKGRKVFHWASLSSLLKLNGDILLRSLLLSTVFAVFTDFSARMGTLILAANSVVIRLFYVGSYVIDGFAFATESLAGIFRGQRDRTSFLRLVRLALVAGAASMILLVGFLAAFQRPIFRVLTSHQDVIALASSYLPWLVPVLLIGSAAFVYDGIFLGLTAGRELRNSMLVSTLLVFLPAAWIAVRQQSAELLWLAMTLFMLARAASLWWTGRRMFQTIAKDAIAEAAHADRSATES